jgi:hypothetical protein
VQKPFCPAWRVPVSSTVIQATERVNDFDTSGIGI